VVSANHDEGGSVAFLAPKGIGIGASGKLSLKRQNGTRQGHSTCRYRPAGLLVAASSLELGKPAHNLRQVIERDALHVAHPVVVEQVSRGKDDMGMA
jgi:hypothetical protein